LVNSVKLGAAFFARNVLLWKAMARKAPARSTGQHHGDLKHALLQTATQLVEAGNVEFSLRELAREAGVTPAAPYHHFSGKAAVLDDVATVGFHKLDAALDHAIAASAAPELQLAQMVRGYLDFAHAHASHYQIMFPPGLGTDPEHQALRTVAEMAFARLLGGVRKVRPEASDENLFLWAFSVWAMCHGFLLMQRDGLLHDEMPFGGFAQLMPKIAELSADLVRNSGTKKRR
jgi:AcrR family transcriptional regulator